MWLLPWPRSLSDRLSYWQAPLSSRALTTRWFDRRLLMMVIVSRASTATRPPAISARVRVALRRRAASAAASRSVRVGPVRSRGGFAPGFGADGALAAPPAAAAGLGAAPALEPPPGWLGRLAGGRAPDLGR